MSRMFGTSTRERMVAASANQAESGFVLRRLIKVEPCGTNRPRVSSAGSEVTEG
ncbi:hypothetical protein AG1IA_00309 [Rhizoctonia solani AG-1 IA]|uniref:Uncharacterized protein n=1 Tax=Thanatephorus cucumeris (strain AG1-IA) TaxID=983506 RepID=L8X639_THACA|nr:hypothetical protein AG1IA_00309 [Rhizoctonia solani AG-1 IA]